MMFNLKIYALSKTYMIDGISSDSTPNSEAVRVATMFVSSLPDVAEWSKLRIRYAI